MVLVFSGRCGHAMVGRSADRLISMVCSYSASASASNAGNLAVYAALDVIHRLVVYREDAVLRTGLDGHVADGEAVVHGQRVCALADELHRLVQRAVHADLADDVQDNVLAGYPRAQLAGEHKLDGARHLEPCLAGRHACGEIGKNRRPVENAPSAP